MTWLFLLIGFVLGGLCGWGIAYPAIKKRTLYNESIAKQNKELETLNQIYKKQKICFESELDQLVLDKAILEEKIFYLDKEKETKQADIKILNEQAKMAGELFYEENMALAQEHLMNDLEKTCSNFNKEKEKYETDYLELLNDLSQAYVEESVSYKEAIDVLRKDLSELQSKVTAAVEANKRAEMERTQKDFYKLILTDEDIAEIALLRQAAQTLRHKEPINKVIWKVYYEKPYTDLIGRVVGNKQKTGIYKITNLKNGMCYIGQAISIADRWRQHIKRGIGAETPTRNKLYPAMLSIGVENFSFEIIEECERSQLNEREDYWQDFYKAKEFGYSIK